MTLHLPDANVLIRADGYYYPINRIPPFWDWLLEQAEQGRVKVPQQIYNEVALFRGQLPEWLKQPYVRKAIVLDEPTMRPPSSKC
jgi:hypothetical protein